MRLFSRFVTLALMALLLCPIALSAASPWDRHRQDRGYISDPREQARQKSQAAAMAAQKELAALYDELESMRHSKAFQRAGLTFWHQKSVQWAYQVRALAERLQDEGGIDYDLREAPDELLRLARAWKNNPDGSTHRARSAQDAVLRALGRVPAEPDDDMYDENWYDEDDDEETAP